MINFDNLWQLLYEHGSTDRDKTACAQLWETLSQQQQQQLFTEIKNKIIARKFLHYNPLRAMRENLSRQKQEEPEFLHGNESGDLVQVRYNGLYKICSRETAEKFNLEIIRQWT